MLESFDRKKIDMYICGGDRLTVNKSLRRGHTLNILSWNSWQNVSSFN